MAAMARPLSFRWDEGFLARLDEARGDVPRSRFVRRAVEQALSEAKEPPINEQVDSGSVFSPEDVKSTAPAEQPGAREAVVHAKPVEHTKEELAAARRATFSPLGPPGRARRSDEAKRGVGPIVKGGKR